MKPQALQEAIKANALKKAQKREKEWQDPYTKKHPVTAEEYAAAKAKGTPASAPVFAASAAPAIGSEVLQRIERDRIEMKKANESLLEEMKQLRDQVKECKTLINGLSTSKDKDRPVEQKKATESSSDDIKQIREQLKECKTLIDGLFNENKQLKEDVVKLKNELATVQSAPATPKKPEKPSLNPFTATEMAEMQRKDKALKEYLKTQQGLFPYKSMSVHEYEGQHIVLFYRKIYVPLKSREKTIDWFFKNHKADAEAALNKNFIWLEIDKDVADYKAKK